MLVDGSYQLVLVWAVVDMDPSTAKRILLRPRPRPLPIPILFFLSSLFTTLLYIPYPPPAILPSPSLPLPFQ